MSTVSKEGNEYIFRLSKYEANVLCAIFSHIGGDPSGPRGVTQNLYENLIDILNDNEDDLNSKLTLCKDVPECECRTRCHARDSKDEASYGLYICDYGNLKKLNKV